MSDVKFSLELRGPVFGAPAIVDVVNVASKRVVSTLQARIGQPLPISVADGHYLVRARLPSGERRQVTIDASAENARAVLAFSASPHEWLAGARNVNESLHRLGESRQVDMSRFHFELRAFHNGGWVPVGGPVAVQNDASAANLVIAPWSPPELQAIRLEYPDACRFTLLPTWGELNVVISYPPDGDASGAPSLTITRRDDPDFDSLVAQLHAGDFAGVQTAKESYAVRLFSENQDDPIGAALGAYVLVRLRSLDRLCDWSTRFAQLFPWLPDTAIIRAAYLALTGGEHDAEITALVRAAVAAGPPVFTEGMHLLTQLLEINVAPQDAAELRQKTARARSEWDRNVPFTTFVISTAKRNESPDVWSLA